MDKKTQRQTLLGLAATIKAEQHDELVSSWTNNNNLYWSEQPTPEAKAVRIMLYLLVWLVFLSVVLMWSQEIVMVVDTEQTKSEPTAQPYQRILTREERFVEGYKGVKAFLYMD